MTYQYQDDSELCPEEEIYSGPDEIFHNRFFRLAGDPENEEQEMLLRDTLWLIWVSRVISPCTRRIVLVDQMNI